MNHSFIFFIHPHLKCGSPCRYSIQAVSFFSSLMPTIPRHHLPTYISLPKPISPQSNQRRQWVQAKYKQHRLGNTLAILWRTHHTIREDWEVGIHNAVWKITGYTLFTRVYPALHHCRLSNCLQIHTLCVILELSNVHCYTVYHNHFCHSNVMTLDRSAVHCSPL